jgi:hypothetical protein
MTPKQYRDALEAIDLTIVGAATFFELSERTSRYYAAQGTGGAVEMLLRVMMARDITVEEVDQLMKRKTNVRS